MDIFGSFERLRKSFRVVKANEEYKALLQQIDIRQDALETARSMSERCVPWEEYLEACNAWDEYKLEKKRSEYMSACLDYLGS